MDARNRHDYPAPRRTAAPTAQKAHPLAAAFHQNWLPVMLAEYDRGDIAPDLGADCDRLNFAHYMLHLYRTLRDGAKMPHARSYDLAMALTDKIEENGGVVRCGAPVAKILFTNGEASGVVLRDGDELIIPEMASTVRIQGEVLYPNTVHYISGKPIRYYVRQAGGFSTRARRMKTYVVYMNGTVAVGSWAKLEPGCEIVVPPRNEKDKLTTGEWLSIGTSAASITTMVATIVNLFKK